MSRSYRRPFAAITGTASAKDDKRLAHRGVRRKQNLALKICADFENLLLPHPLECPWNNNYCWGRDGAQCYNSPWYELGDERPRRWYLKLLRK
jgi:hypothetical protein